MLFFEVPAWLADYINLIASLLIIVFSVAVFFTGRILTADADLRISQANEAAAASNERSRALEVESARLTHETEFARLELERLKQRVAWRSLTEAQKNTISQELSGHGLEVDVIYNPSDPEASTYSVDFMHALQRAGVKVVNSPMMSFGIEIGVQLGGPGGSNFDLMKIALDRAGVPIQATPQMPSLRLIIGQKPRPNL